MAEFDENKEQRESLLGVRAVLRCTACFALLGVPSLAAAQSISDLQELVRKQTAQIADLNARLALLEKGQRDLKGDQSQLAQRQSEDHKSIVATQAAPPRVLAMPLGRPRPRP